MLSLRYKTPVLLLLVCLARPVPAQQPQQRAEALDTQAKKLIRTQPAEAISLWTEAMRIAPQPKFVYNIAVAYEWMKRRDRALEYYEKYLELSPDAPDREEVRNLIGALQKRLSRRMSEVIIEPSPPDTQVFVDGVLRSRVGGRSTFWLSFGRHLLRLRRSGHVGEEREIVVERGKAISLKVQLNPIERFGYLDIIGQEDEAEVLLDGAAAGKTPIVNFKVTPGRHEVVLSKQGFVSWSKQVTIQPDVKVVLNYDLSPTTRPSILVRPVKTKRTAVSTWGWVAAGSGVAFVLVGGLFNWKATQLAAEANDLPLTGLGQEEVEYREEYNRKRSQAQRYMSGTVACYVLGGAAIVAGVVMLIVDTPEGRPRTQVGLTPTRTGGVLSLGGDF